MRDVMVSGLLSYLPTLLPTYLLTGSVRVERPPIAFVLTLSVW